MGQIKDRQNLLCWRVRVYSVPIHLRFNNFICILLKWRVIRQPLWWWHYRQLTSFTADVISALGFVRCACFPWTMLENVSQLYAQHAAKLSCIWRAQLVYVLQYVATADRPGKWNERNRWWKIRELCPRDISDAAIFSAILQAIKNSMPNINHLPK